jgi:hypothetical protein
LWVQKNRKMGTLALQWGFYDQTIPNNTMTTDKYSRTYHFPFSLGTTSDDRILYDWQALLQHKLVVTEKLDGENTCLKATGVYARSHAAPTRSAWSGKMWELWEMHKAHLGDLHIFGESLYAIHSIEYARLEHYYYVFAIRDGNTWLAWDDVCLYAHALDLPTVPVIERKMFDETELQQSIQKHLLLGSRLGGECEGFVVRNENAFSTDLFHQNVLKYVRKNHVKTDEHWTKNWQRAQLWFEQPTKTQP